MCTFRNIIHHICEWQDCVSNVLKCKNDRALTTMTHQTKQNSETVIDLGRSTLNIANELERITDFHDFNKFKETMAKITSMSHGPLTRYVKLRVTHVPGMPGTFSPPPTSKGTAS